MNTTIRTLVLAAPVAAMISLGSSAAFAEVVPGPVIIVQPTPEPDLDDIAIPEPKPQPPKDIAQPEDDGPKGPQDKAPAPKPEGPQDKAPAPQPAAEDAVDTEDSSETTADETAETADELVGVTSSADRLSTDLDAVPSTSDVDENGLGLLWLLVGGAVVSATGGYVVKRRTARA